MVYRSNGLLIKVPLPVRKAILFVLFMGVIPYFTPWGNAQPKPCGTKPDMTTTCAEACVICDIDGYVGINDDPERGQAPPGFCTGTVHHMQWIAFIAGSTDLTITVTPSGCKLGSGLEVGIYESIDCNNFRLVSNCNGGIAPGQTAVFNNTTPLVIGQHYYFVMDGNGNDVCNYTIRVTKGSTKVPPLADTGPVKGSAVVCQGDSTIYSVSPVSGANFYQWRLDGRVVAWGLEAKIAFPDAGVHRLCVTAFNVCDTSEAACIVVQVNEDKATRVVEELCEGSCFFIGATRICDPGDYTFRLLAASGCDSIVQVSVSRKFTVSSFLNTYLCSTDSLLVGDSWYRPPGSYIEIQPSSTGCDSLIHLTLKAIICEIIGTTRIVPVLCHAGSSGAFEFTVRDGTPPFFFTWERLGGGPSGSGSLDSLNAGFRAVDLPSGSYLVAVRDTFGNDAVFAAVVTEPPPLSLSFKTSDYRGYSITCHGGADGMLTAVPSGGSPPYTYLWGNGRSQPVIGALSAGVYAVTIADANGCRLSGATTLNAPLPLLYGVRFAHPNCDGYYTGRIAVQPPQGGVAPYRFAVNSEAFQDSMVFAGLGEGIYTINVRDQNGCTADTTITLVAAQIPVLDLDGAYPLKLGYSVRLDASVNLQPKTIAWTPPEGLSCTDCLQPQASPVKNTVYTLRVTSADDCPAIDSIAVTLLKFRHFFAPNTFSPNGDGINDFFTIFGGPAVLRLKSLKVFSRWGELLFERSDFEAGDPILGWDGQYQGKTMEGGVFVWWAAIEYVDGVSEIAKGEVALVR